MNATERSALLDAVAFSDELNSAVDGRTREVLNSRRRTAVVRRRGWLVRRTLLLADVVALSVAFVSAQLIFGSSGQVDPVTEVLLFLATLPGWVVLAKVYGLYDHDEERTDHSTVDDVVGVFHLITVGAWVSFAGAWLAGVTDPNLAKLVTFWALSFALVTLGRSSGRAFCRRRLTYLQNTVIVGAGTIGQLVGRKFMHHPEYGINLVGFVDDAPKERRPDLMDLTVLGPP